MPPHKVLQVKNIERVSHGKRPSHIPMKAFLRLLMSVLFVTAPVGSPARAQTPVVVSDAQAEQHIGQDVTVEGVVTAVSTSRRGNTFISFGGAYPNPTFYQLDSRWLLTLRYRHCRGRRSRSSEELSFTTASLRSESSQRVRLLKSEITRAHVGDNRVFYRVSVIMTSPHWVLRPRPSHRSFTFGGLATKTTPSTIVTTQNLR
jgi:hypothetical protein